DENTGVPADAAPTPPSGPLALRQAGANDMYKKRYNVAASRAQDQMWVVHSLDPTVDLQPADLRRRLITHAIDPSTLMRQLQQGTVRTESEFERQVLSALVARNYRVIPQWAVGKYRIDLVVEGGVEGRLDRLAVECDGDRYHPIDKIPEDMARQAVLERIGWKFERIRGSEWFLDQESAFQPLIRRLNALGILPREDEVENKKLAVDSVRDDIIREAEAIRRDLMLA
ncbi:MAG: hypothetical protein SGJ20_04800, partial [Planctomycetota bacterium]|nr:hypothetical protein [Planctomycetota bacterium]